MTQLTSEACYFIATTKTLQRQTTNVVRFVSSRFINSMPVYNFKL